MIDFTNTNYTPAQELKLTLLALNKAVSHELPGMNMWADMAVDQDGEPPSQEDAAEAWRTAMLDTNIDGAIDAVMSSDTTIDLEPLIAELKADGVWDDMPKGWSKPEVA